MVCSSTIALKLGEASPAHLLHTLSENGLRRSHHALDDVLVRDREFALNDLHQGISMCHSSASTFCSPGCPLLLTDSAGTYWRTRSVKAVPRAWRRSRRVKSVGVQDVVALLVDHLALVVGNVVVLQQLLADVEIARLTLRCALSMLRVTMPPRWPRPRASSGGP